MKRLSLIFLYSAFSLGAAVTAGTTWEVRTTGSNTNGGGFDSATASAGTDMSVFDNKNAAGCTSCQSATINISTTDAVATGTAVTSATANFSSALIGNAIYLTGGGGTPATTGWYIVTAVGSATAITVTPTTGGSGGGTTTMNIGGALLTAPQACTNYAAGNTIYIKDTATYSISSGITCATAASATPLRIIGYTATRGDDGFVTFQPTTGMTMFTGGTNNWVSNIVMDCNSVASCTSFAPGGGNILRHVKALNFTTRGIFANSASTVDIINSEVTGGVSGCSKAIDMQVNGSVADSVILSNLCPGINIAASAVYILNNLIAKNTGTTDGIVVAIGTSYITGNTISNNGRYGIVYSSAPTTWVMRNNLIANNAGAQQVNNQGTSMATYSFGSVDFNGYFGTNCTNSTQSACVSGIPLGAHDVYASADPLSDTSTNNFTLNNTAGSGAAMKAAGFPGAMIAGGTGYRDIGSLQSQGASGGGQRVYGVVR